MNEKHKISYLRGGGVQGLSAKDAIDSFVSGLPKASEQMLEMVQDLVKHAETNTKIQEGVSRLIELGYTYNPIEDLEKDIRFNQALLVAQEFLKPNGLILLRFLINRSYFVGYNQGYDDNTDES